MKPSEMLNFAWRNRSTNDRSVTPSSNRHALGEVRTVSNSKLLMAAVFSINTSRVDRTSTACWSSTMSTSTQNMGYF
jgi:hypothetical protein